MSEKISLQDREWKSFTIKELFDTFESGKIKNASILDEGDVPYIAATNRNNGVKNFVAVSNKQLSKGNCIAFIGQGDGSAGYSVYKAEDSAVASTVICGYSKHLNREIGLFISCCSDLNKSKYSHGYSRSDTRLKRDRIMLPVNDQGSPDYEFMEAYVRERERVLLDRYKLAKYERN